MTLQTLAGFGLCWLTWYALYRASLNLESPQLYARAPAVAAIVAFFWGVGIRMRLASAYENPVLALQGGFYFAVGVGLAAWLWPKMAEQEIGLVVPDGMDAYRES